MMLKHLMMVICSMVFNYPLDSPDYMLLKSHFRITASLSHV